MERERSCETSSLVEKEREVCQKRETKNESVRKILWRLSFGVRWVKEQMLYNSYLIKAFYFVAWTENVLISSSFPAWLWIIHFLKTFLVGCFRVKRPPSSRKDKFNSNSRHTEVHFKSLSICARLALFHQSIHLN